MNAVRLAERPFEVVAASGRVLHSGPSVNDAKREAETAILAGQADRVRIYGTKGQLLMEATRVGPRHVAWYAKGETNGH